MREIIEENVDFFHRRMKIKAAPSVERVSKRPKNRFFARLYWKDEESLFIGKILLKFQGQVPGGDIHWRMLPMLRRYFLKYI